MADPGVELERTFTASLEDAGLIPRRRYLQRTPGGDTWVRCAALRDGHLMSHSDHNWAVTPAVRRVPFAAAVGGTARCPVHGLPMVTVGGWRWAAVSLLARERGLPLPERCDDGYSSCHEHRWYPSHGDVGWRDDERLPDGRCPHQPLVALLNRRQARAL